MGPSTRVAPDNDKSGYPAAGYRSFVFPDIQNSAGYPVSGPIYAPKNRFLPEFRAFNYQIQYTAVSAGISIFYNILTITGSKLFYFLLAKIVFLTGYPAGYTAQYLSTFVVTCTM